MAERQSNYLDDLPADSALLRYEEYYDEYFNAEETECWSCYGTGLDRDEVYDCPVCFGDGVLLTTPPVPDTVGDNDANEEGGQF